MSTAPSFRPRIWYLLLVCLVAALGGFLFGFDTAVISGVVSFVKGEFSMSAAREGWFVSSALLGCIIGVAMAGKLADSFGRKMVLILSALLFTVSALGCMLVHAESTLITYRLVGGLGIGVASMVSPLYISEFSPARLRGRMVTLYQLAITVGILCAYFSNAWLLGLSTAQPSPINPGSFWSWIITAHVWRAMLGMGILPAFVFLVCLCMVPESPRWLLTRGRDARAVSLLGRVNGEEAALAEAAAIKASFSKENARLKELLSPVYRTALIIGLLLPFLSQVSGINAVIYYGPRILDEAGFTLGSAFGGQVTIGVVNVLFTFVAILMVDRWGRRPLLLLGVSLAIAALVSIGLLFHFGVVEGPWILILILVYIASFAFSFGPVCWVIIGEIFPTTVRGRAMGLATLSLWVANFFVGQLTPMMLDGIGPAGTFWIFAALCSPTIWLTWKLIPETRGRSLEEIESAWKQGPTSGRNL